MMAGTPTLCKKHGGIISSFPLRQDCSHVTTAIANNHLLLADGSGISALACAIVYVRDSLAHPSKASDGFAATKCAYWFYRVSF